MDFFVLNETVAQLEAQLRGASAAQRLPLLVQLAWQLRQCNTQRALQLTEQAQELLAQGKLAAPVRQAIEYRLDLVQGEVAWLEGDLARSKHLSERACQGFIRLGDKVGQADACFLSAMRAQDQADGTRIRVALQQFSMLPPESDPMRRQIGHSALARFALDRGALSAEQRSAQQALAQTADLNPAIQSWVQDFMAADALLLNDFGLAEQCHIKAYEYAIASGQLRRAIDACIGVGTALSRINEHHAALEWMQRALMLARQAKWPACIGSALTQTAEIMHRLQQPGAAFDLVQEALATLMPVAGSSHYALAMRLLGEIELERQEYQNALNTFELVEQRANELHHSDLHCLAQRGQACALSRLGQGLLAQKAAEAALANARQQPWLQIQALQVLARLHDQHVLPAPAGLGSASSATQYYLHQALALAEKIEGYTTPERLLDELAQEYAKHGDYAKAWQYGQQANAAREKNLTVEANRRARAVQVNQQTERARLEAEHHRALAQAERQRATVLQKTTETLERLSVIGQEITAQLETDRVFQVLNRHIHHLLDVDVLALYQLDETGTTLHPTFGLVEGQSAPGGRIHLSHPVAQAALCARERHEILINHEPDENTPPVKGRNQAHSALFAPLCVGDQLLGVMMIQSFQRYAYGDHERHVFRTLCSYGAIALANADAHQQLASTHERLQQTQRKLLLQEKMAGLGTLTAGVAHEINNPTNFVHVAAQNQQVDLNRFEAFMGSVIEADDAPEIVQTIRQYFARLRENVTTMQNGTNRIKGIVQDLRAFTRLDQAEKRTIHISECINSTLNLVRTSWLDQVQFFTEFSDDPEIECWPALLNQVFMNLLVNACQAIASARQAGQYPDPEHKGRIALRTYYDANQLKIEITDNGCGMSMELQTRILEPFFTTKTVGEGTGLGLSITYGIVTRHEGHLSFSSTPGVGSCFTLSLPLAQNPGPPSH
jgi:signal transduction histidine kinase